MPLWNPIRYLLALAGLGPACSPAPLSIVKLEVPEPAMPPESDHAWIRDLDCRIELPVPGEPSGVLFEDLDGDGREELLATARGRSNQTGSLAVWHAVDAPPLLLEIPDYPLAPVPADAGRVWVASQASDELLLIAPLATDGNTIQRRVALRGRPRALTQGSLSGIDHLAAVATREGRLVVVPVDGEPSEHELHLQAPTFVRIDGKRVFVGAQDPGTVHVFHWDKGQLLAADPIPLGAIPRAMWSGNLGGHETEIIAGGGRNIWRRSPTGWQEIGPSGAIPLRLIDGPSGELFGLSFYDLAWRRYGPDLKVLDKGYTGQDPWHIAASDWDRDGITDLAFANRGAHRISVLPGDFDRDRRAAATLPCGGGPHSIAAGDIDSDGDLDLISIDALDDSLSFHLATGKGTFVRSSFRPPSARNGDRARLADLDGDGDLELAHRIESGGQAGVRIWIGQSAEQVGALPSQSVEVVTGGSIGDLLAADIDGDGRMELLAADPQQAQVHILTWKAGDDRPVLASTFGVGGSPSTLAFEAATSDRAGRLWIGLGGTGARQGVAWFELSDTTKMHELGFAATQSEPLDLALCQGPQGFQPILLARPSGPDGPGRLIPFVPALPSSWRPGPAVTTGTRPFALATGDWNADGVDEIVVGAQNSHHVNLWSWNADGKLARLPDLGAGRGVLDVRMVQLRPNGRPSVVAANAFSNDLTVIHQR